MDYAIFTSTDSEYRARNGQWVDVLREITEADDEFDAEVLPMYQVRFPDGVIGHAFADELQ